MSGVHYGRAERYVLTSTFFVYKMFRAAAPARASSAVPSIPNLAAAPVLWGIELLAVAVDEPEEWLPTAAVPEAEVLTLVRNPVLAAAELLEAADALALALALPVTLAVALPPPLSISAPLTTVAVMKATSLPDSTAVCVSSPVISAVQVISVAFEL